MTNFRQQFLQWLEIQLKFSLVDIDPNIDQVYVHGVERSEPALWAIQYADYQIIQCLSKWADPIQKISNTLTPTELFSTFGAYELTRVISGDQAYGVWGPSWYFVADETCFLGRTAPQVEMIEGVDWHRVDHKIYWHCFPGEAEIGFATQQQDKIVALAAVKRRGEGLWEIGIDVAPRGKGQGLGRQVFGTAGGWVLDRGGIILATTAPWNVPSARLLRSMGLQFVMTDLCSTPDRFYLPPQPLGQPLPDMKMYDYYPQWAKNQSLKDP